MEKKEKEIKFCDNIVVSYFGEDENYIYNIIYNTKDGLGLKSENSKLIKYLLLGNTKLIALYKDGSVKVSKNKVKSVKVSDYKFSKRLHVPIEGNLLLYNHKMAKLYGLNEEGAYYDSSFVKTNIKRRKK